MAYQAPKQSFARRFKEAYKEGVREVIKKQYDKFQYQTTLNQVPNKKGIMVRQFENKEDAESFERSVKYEYPHTKVKLDGAYFVGIPCDAPQTLYVVYYGKEDFRLIPNKSHKIVKSATYQPDSVQCMGWSNTLYRGGALTARNEKDIVQ